MSTCKHGNTGDCALCSHEDAEHDAAMAAQADDELAALRRDAEHWRRALSAYERNVLMGYDGRTGERDGYISEFLAAIRERDGAA